jgi:ABC-type nickel/cobalt efflux system permease component RcnA/hydrogenase/urease accessory protein HupE
LIAVLALFLPTTVHAHLVNTDVGEFYGGMMHPVTSAEHLLPILVLALLGGQCGKQAARATLFAFPAALLAGTVIGSVSPPYGFLAPLNLIILLGLGMLLALNNRLPAMGPTAMALLAGITGLVLGYRSGTDMAVAQVAFQFVPGVALTGFILVALIAAWVPVLSSRGGQIFLQLTGTACALAGMVLLIQFATGAESSLTRAARMPGQEEMLVMLRSGDLSASVLAGTLLTAMIWGAGHALTPGHGKAIVGAYLIGARSTPWHAVYLGLTVTLTHTLGVFVLGLIALFASQYVLPEQLYPWLGTVSGLIVVGLGLYMLSQRLGPLIAGRKGQHHHHHDHSHHHHHEHTHHADERHHTHFHVHEHSGKADHNHTHDHHGHDNHGHHDHSHDHAHSHLPPGADGGPVSWRSILLLGVSGGLLPCPSALVLLLAAVSMNRAGFGMALVVAFSFGLAAVLTVVGLLFVKGSTVVQHVPRFTVWQRYLPVASALVITVLGVVLMTEAAMSIGL